MTDCVADDCNGKGNAGFRCSLGKPKIQSSRLWPKYEQYIGFIGKPHLKCFHSLSCSMVCNYFFL